MSLKLYEKLTYGCDHSDWVEEWSWEGPLVLGNVVAVVAVRSLLDDARLVLANNVGNL